MKKIEILFIILCLTSVALISGCSEQNNNNVNGKVMTAEQLHNDTETFSGNNITINYKSLNDGDTLIIKDTIFKINYDFVYNKTIILFVWNLDDPNASMFFEFAGDITGSYANDDQVKITVDIKHVVFDYQGVTHDIELFKQQWVDENYFNTNRYKPLPASAILKV